MTGVVDALAYLRLGHVFVSNMTGNVVFLGFAAAGAGGLSVPGSLLALACFLPGGMAAGRLTSCLGDDRRRQLSAATASQLVLCAVAIPIAAVAADSWLGGSSGARTPRRVLAVGAMLLGAILGAVLLLQVAPFAPLALAATLLALVAASACRRRGKPVAPPGVAEEH